MPRMGQFLLSSGELRPCEGMSRAGPVPALRSRLQGRQRALSSNLFLGVHARIPGPDLPPLRSGRPLDCRYQNAPLTRIFPSVERKIRRGRKDHIRIDKQSSPRSGSSRGSANHVECSEFETRTQRPDLPEETIPVFDARSSWSRQGGLLPRTLWAGRKVGSGEDGSKDRRTHRDLARSTVPASRAPEFPVA